MLSSWAAAILILGLSVFVGRATARLAGRASWTGLEPAVGFAAMLAVGGLFARLPGGRWPLILSLAALLAASAWILRRPRREDLPKWCPGLGLTLVIVFAVVNIPFLITGGWGLLGVGYNNDLGLHLAWTDWLRSGIGTEPTAGYPLGPHALVAVLAFIPGVGTATIFTGLLIAIVLLIAWTAWVALDRLSGWRRVLATTLAAVGYLLASWYAQAAFKELAAALFLLAFALWIADAHGDGRRIERRSLLVPTTLCAGIIFSYSFPGLVWPLVVLLAVAVSRPGVRSRLSPSRLAQVLRRPLVAGGILLAGVVVLLLAFAGPFGFSGAFAEVASSNAFGPVSPVEGLGVWLNPDYRLWGSTDTTLPLLCGIVGVAALLTSLWWWFRQSWSVWPVAFLGCLFVYLISLPWMGDYSLAKALTVATPVTMVVILTGLLSGPPAGHGSRGTLLRVGWSALAAIFVLGAVASSFLVLRDAPVARTHKVAELLRFLPILNGKRVLYLDQDRYAPWYLSGAHVGVPLADFPDPDVIQNPRKPFQGTLGQTAIDFDSFLPETFDNFGYAITSAAAWQSAPPPFFEEVKRSNNFILWRRTEPATGRRIMLERNMPAKLVDCETESGSYFRDYDGTATLMPETEVIRRTEWDPGVSLRPGQSASAEVVVPKGEWRLSLQYFTPDGFVLKAPGINRPFLPAVNGQRLANLDFGSSGQYWPAGVLKVDREKPVKFTITTHEPSTVQRLTGYSRRTQIGKLVLTRNQLRQRVPMSQICDRWVDFFRPVSAGSGDTKSLPSN